MLYRNLCSYRLSCSRKVRRYQTQRCCSTLVKATQLLCQGQELKCTKTSEVTNSLSSNVCRDQVCDYLDIYIKPNSTRYVKPGQFHPSTLTRVLFLFYFWWPPSFLDIYFSWFVSQGEPREELWMLSTSQIQPSDEIGCSGITKGNSWILTAQELT